MNDLFRKRIGFPENEKITFESLGKVLEKTAEAIPFENLCVIENRNSELSKENLVNKILVKNEGGLCYDLNLILYFFLIENGFNVVLARGTTYNHVAQKFQPLKRTHVVILITHQGQAYLIDTGFGANLPLKPVPLTGETVISYNGEFRVKRVKDEHGDYVFEMKLKHKNEDWKIGYAFDSHNSINDLSELNEIQRIIIEHELSPFNKSPIITQLTTSGNLTLTSTSFTQWIDGAVSKEEIDNARFKALLKQHFGI
jgi:N-hydroxyarylamine O-acetyltransferase